MQDIDQKGVKTGRLPLPKMRNRVQGFDEVEALVDKGVEICKTQRKDVVIYVDERLGMSLCPVSNGRNIPRTPDILHVKMWREEVAA